MSEAFAHLHSVRLMWLKSAAPELFDGLSKLDGTTGDKATLAAALEASDRAVADLLRKA